MLISVTVSVSVIISKVSLSILKNYENLFIHAIVLLEIELH